MAIPEELFLPSARLGAKSKQNYTLVRPVTFPLWGIADAVSNVKFGSSIPREGFIPRLVRPLGGAKYQVEADTARDIPLVRHV